MFQAGRRGVQRRQKRRCKSTWPTLAKTVHTATPRNGAHRCPLRWLLVCVLQYQPLGALAQRPANPYSVVSMGSILLNEWALQ